MSYLRKHWHHVCFGLLVLSCATVVTLHVDQCEPESFSQLDADVQHLREVLAAGQISKQYRYGDAALARLPQRRPDVGVPAYAPAGIVYPRPGKPTIDPASIVRSAEVVEQVAELPPVTALRTFAERGSIRVEFQLPAAAHMTLVRADIYRCEGTDPHQLDTRLPFASVDLTTAKAVENWIRYADTHVEPKHAYLYCVRLVAAMHANRSEKDDAGHIVREIHYVAPVHALTFPEDASRRFFASELSAPVRENSPSNFEILFKGTTGAVPVAGADTLAAEYTGRFVVRIWIHEIQEWKEANVEVHPGDRLQGKVLYRPVPKAELKAYPFDTGKVLEEIRREHVSRIATVHDQVTDENRAPLLDENNQPKTAARTVKTTGIPVDVAVLKDSETGKTEELRK